jgi:hypothetical protein
MVIHVRPVAVSAAIVCFFAIAIVGSLCGVSPYTCCKRAMLGAAVAYVAAAAVLRAVNIILTEAMIESRINREDAGDSQG